MIFRLFIQKQINNIEKPGNCGEKLKEIINNTYVTSNIYIYIYTCYLWYMFLLNINFGGELLKCYVYIVYIHSNSGNKLSLFMACISNSQFQAREWA